MGHGCHPFYGRLEFSTQYQKEEAGPTSQERSVCISPGAKCQFTGKDSRSRTLWVTNETKKHTGLSVSEVRADMINHT